MKYPFHFVNVILLFTNLFPNALTVKNYSYPILQKYVSQHALLLNISASRMPEYMPISPADMVEDAFVDEVRL